MNIIMFLFLASVLFSADFQFSQDCNIHLVYVHINGQCKQMLAQPFQTVFDKGKYSEPLTFVFYK